MHHVEGSRHSSDGTELHWQAWLPEDGPRAVVVVSHGLGEHSGRYGNVVDALVPRGYAMYALDHRGHGRSGGPRAYVEHLDTVVDDFEQFRSDACARHVDTPSVVLGHSFGGLVALAHARRFGATQAGMVLSAPASAGGSRTSFRRVLHSRVEALIAPRRPVLQVDARLVSRDPAVVEDYVRDPLVFHGAVPARTVAEMRSRARGMPRESERIRTPVLLLHGGDDAIIPAEASRLLAARIGSADVELHVYDRLYHEVFNEPEREVVLGDVVAWLDARVT